MNAVKSDPRSKPPVEDAAAVALTAKSGIVVAHSSSLVLLAAILGNNIYLLVGDGVHMLVEEARKSKRGTAERQVSLHLDIATAQAIQEWSSRRHRQMW